MNVIFWIDVSLALISIIGSFFFFRKFRLSFVMFWGICTLKFMHVSPSWIVSAHVLLIVSVALELHRMFYLYISKHLTNNFYHELFYTRSFVTQYSYRINQNITHMYCLIDNILTKKLDSEICHDVQTIKQRCFQLAHILEEFSTISGYTAVQEVDFLNEYHATLEKIIRAKPFAEHIQISVANKPLIPDTPNYQCNAHLHSVLTGVLIRMADCFIESVPVELLVSQHVDLTKERSLASITIQTSLKLPKLTFDSYYFNYITDAIQVQQTSPQTVTINVDIAITKPTQTIITNEVPLRRLLLVEDDFLLGETLRNLFIRRGCDTVHVPDGKAALECVENQHFDLILCDIVMPVMSGIMFMNKAAQITACPIQLMTGYPTNFTESMFNIIRKPIDFDQLVYSLKRKGFILSPQEDSTT